jgi:hypothetical protein
MLQHNQLIREPLRLSVAAKGVRQFSTVVTMVGITLQLNSDYKVLINSYTLKECRLAKADVPNSQCPGKPFHPSLMFGGKARGLL